jgi:hypothetical protein
MKNLKRRDHERPRHRWEDNIKLDPKEIQCEGVDLNQLSLDRVQ